MLLEATKTIPPLVALSFVMLISACAATPDHRSTGEALDDVAIGSRVKTALLADSTTDGIDIEVEVDRGIVQLNGFADSTEEVKRAETITEDIKGVRRVINNLRVAEGSRRLGEYVDDKVLVGRVKGALARDPAVNSLSIEVEVNRSVVMLGGFVQSESERSSAVLAAQRVKGIREVVNNLAIRNSGR